MGAGVVVGGFGLGAGVGVGVGFGLGFGGFGLGAGAGLGFCIGSVVFLFFFLDGRVSFFTNTPAAFTFAVLLDELC